MTPSRKLGTLEVGRGIAAIAVVAHHSAQASDAFTSQSRLEWLHHGALGVDFFFVLSGFIIYHAHHNDPRSFKAASVYIRKRLRRIYVPYLPISLILILAYSGLPLISQTDRDWGLFTSLTLLPSGHPPALSVAWTLVFEMMFYVVFLAFFITRHFWLLMCVWATASVCFWIGKGHGTAPLETFLNPLILEFIAGMVMAVGFKKLPSYLWLHLILVGAVITCVYFYHGSFHRVVFGFGLAPIVLGIAMSETKFRVSIPNVIMLIGSASYAIYLIHNPLQSLIVRTLTYVDSWWFTFSACTIGGVFAGIIYHTMFERPVLRSLPRIVAQ